MGLESMQSTLCLSFLSDLDREIKVQSITIIIAHVGKFSTPAASNDGWEMAPKKCTYLSIYISYTGVTTSTIMGWRRLAESKFRMIVVVCEVNPVLIRLDSQNIFHLQNKSEMA